MAIQNINGNYLKITHVGLNGIIDANLYKDYATRLNPSEYDYIKSFNIYLGEFTNEDVDETLVAFEAIREKLENGTYKEIASKTKVDLDA